MRLYQSIPVIDGFFSLTYGRNTGAAFSMLSDAPPLFFITLGVVVSIGVLWWLRKNPYEQKMVAIALVLVQGGAIGNVIDRALPSRGYVIDFIDFLIGHCTYCHWPAFNVADTAIVIGAGLLLLDAFRRPAADNPPGKGRAQSKGRGRKA